MARPPGEMNDWAAFYVNMYAHRSTFISGCGTNENSFTDQDMFARFAGVGVGHLVPNIQYNGSSVENDMPFEEPEDKDIVMQCPDTDSDGYFVNGLEDLDMSDAGDINDEDKDGNEDDTDTRSKASHNSGHAADE